MRKRVTSVQRSNKPDILIGQRNSQIAYQMRALDAETFGYAKNLPQNQWPAFSVGFLPPQQLKTAAEKQL